MQHWYDLDLEVNDAHVAMMVFCHTGEPHDQTSDGTVNKQVDDSWVLEL